MSKTIILKLESKEVGKNIEVNEENFSVLCENDHGIQYWQNYTGRNRQMKIFTNVEEAFKNIYDPSTQFLYAYDLHE